MEEIIGEALPAYVQCSLFFIVATGARFSRPASPRQPLRHDGAGAASPKPPGRPSLDSGERNRPAWRPDGERLQHRGRVGSPLRDRGRLPRLPGPVALAGRLSLPAQSWYRSSPVPKGRSRPVFLLLTCCMQEGPSPVQSHTWL